MNISPIAVAGGVWAIVAGSFGLVGQALGAGVHLLGFQNGRTARVESISFDASVAVGNYALAGGRYVTCRWENGVRVDSPYAAANSLYTYAVSADGRYMTGFTDLMSSGNAFRVDASWNVQNLGRPTTAFGPATGRALSADGSTVVGYFQSTTTLNKRAFRWTATGGIVNIGHVWGGASGNTQPGGVSADGSIIVGASQPGDYTYPGYAFYWTEATGMRPLPMPGGGPTLEGGAGAISGNGRVILGGLDGRIESGLFWKDLVPAFIPGSAEWIVRGGFALDYTGEHALVNLTPRSNPNTGTLSVGIYTEELGPMLPKDYFRLFGINIPDTAVLDIKCISGDGRSFAGAYSDPVLGVAYQGVVITVPAPGILLTAGMAAAVFTQRRRRPVGSSAAR